MPNRKQIGQLGEDIAAHALSVHGYEIVQRNWRCPSGEVDIVARDADTWVFVEVKARTGTSHGSPEEAVTSEKAENIHDIAMTYFVEHEIDDPDWRIDVVAIYLTQEHKVSRLSLYKNAVLFDG